METMHNISRIRGHPSQIITAIKGMELEMSFKKLKKMKHLTSFEKLKEKFENPPPANALEEVAFNIITARINEIEQLSYPLKFQLIISCHKFN